MHPNRGHNFKDRSGIRYGRLVAIEVVPHEGPHIYWRCICDCGKERTISGITLGKGTNSCGCIRSEKSRERLLTHGMRRTKEYKSWASMLQRCQNKEDAAYDRYGGRGIAVDPSWQSFEQFFKDMGNRPPKTSLERVRNNEGYCKENCIWGTAREQAQNRRTNNNITINGRTECLTEWARISNLTVSTINHRISRGWTPKKAILTPPLRNRT